MLAARGPRAHR